MPGIVFVWQENQPFNFGGFAKYLVTCDNVNWRNAPGLYCVESQFLKALQVELNIDSETAKNVYQTMKELGFIKYESGRDYGVSVIGRLRK